MSSPKRKKIKADDWVLIRDLLDKLDQFSPKDRARYYVKNAVPKTLREEVENF